MVDVVVQELDVMVGEYYSLWYVRKVYINLLKKLCWNFF